jgi:hypothetical protein
MAAWGIQIEQQPLHETHTKYELSDDNSIRISDSELGDGDPIIMTTDTYGEFVAGKVEQWGQIDGSRWFTRIGPAAGLEMNEARWLHFTTHLKKKCSGGGRPTLHVMGVAKSREGMDEGITLSVERRHSNPDRLLSVERRESEPVDSDILVHNVAAEALGQAIDADSDGVLDLDQVSEVLIGLDDNSAQDWTAAAAEYRAPQEAYRATTHVSHVSSVEIMRSELGLETIEILQMERGYGLTYNAAVGTEPETKSDGSVKKEQVKKEQVRKEFFGSVLERFGKADQSEPVFASVYDMASKTKMCNHVRVDKIRKCKNGYRLYLEENQIASTTMTGKSKQCIVTLYGYDWLAIGEPVKEAPAESRPVGAGRPLLKVEHKEWVVGNKNVTVLLDREVAHNQTFGTMQVFFLSNGRKTVLSTVKSVEYDGSKTMVKMDLPADAHDAWLGDTDPYLTMKGIPMAMPARAAALKLTLTAGEPVADQDPRVAEIAEAINAAIDASDTSDIVALADIDEILDESGQGQGDLWGVTGVDVFNGFPGYSQTKSSVVNKIGATVWASSDGKKTYIDIDQGLVGRRGMIYKSTLKDGGGVAEEQVDAPVGLQLEHMRARLGQGGYGAHVSILGVDGVVKCDRERVSKVLRKKKGGRCIYRLVVDHGNKVKTTHPGKRCDCTMYLDERWDLG